MKTSLLLVIALVPLLLAACDVAESSPATSGDSAATGGTASGAGGAAHGTGGDPQNTTGATTGSGGAAPPDDAAFTLLFRDDFDTLDPTRWQLMTHSWATNLALFAADSVSVENGELVLSLLPSPTGTVDDTGTEKPYLGAEVRSRQTLTYGRVRARAKLATGSAVVSSLVTIYTPWPADDWNELDIECLGKEPENVQLNAMVYKGPPVTPPVTQSVTPTQDPEKRLLGFDPSADFHVYTIEWTPEGAFFSVDEQLLRTWTKDIALMTLPQNVLMTIWASSSSAWAGPVTAETSQASAAYDWIELYEYAAP